MSIIFLKNYSMAVLNKTPSATIEKNYIASISVVRFKNSASLIRTKSEAHYH